MWILPVVGYLGLVLGFAFLTLAIASGLYYLSELVEEQTVFAKKLLTRLIYAVGTTQVLLALIDKLPVWASLLSIASHVVYLQNLRFFPIVRLSDPIFILSCLLVLLNHYVWFLHFSRPPPLPANRYTSGPVLPSFSEIASFFFIQVWLVPFSLFVSLSASENILPSMGSEYATDPNSPLASRDDKRGSLSRSSSAIGGFLSVGGGGGSEVRSSSQVRQGALGHEVRGRRRGGAKGLVRVAVDSVRVWVGQSGETLGLWRGERGKRW